MAAMFTMFLLYLAVVGIFVFAYWQIWSKAGFSGAWALLMFIPIVNVAAFFYLAFADWPVHRYMSGPDDFR